MKDSCVHLHRTKVNLLLIEVGAEDTIHAVEVYPNERALHAVMYHLDSND